MILAPTLTLNTPARGFDADATAFAARSGATDVAALSAFVKGVKELGLWNNMVCWPLRSSQNAGNGDTVYSLGGLGTFNGTRVNGPTWTADGIDIDAISERVTTAFNFATAKPSILSVLKPASSAASINGARYMTNDVGGTNRGIGFDAVPASQFRRLAANLGNFGTRTAGVFTAFGLGFGASNTWWAQNGTRTGQSNFSYNASEATLAIAGTNSVFGESASAQYAFAAAWDGVDTSDATWSSLYTLYKSTLGTGLGLP